MTHSHERETKRGVKNLSYHTDTVAAAADVVPVGDAAQALTALEKSKQNVIPTEETPTYSV